jgi:hypothetical protein
VRIPSSFRLMGHTITVELVPPIKWKHPDCIGLFNPQSMSIQVRKGRTSVVEQAVLHEAVHAMFYVLSDDDYEDEQKVDGLAGLMHQALTSIKFGEPRHPRRSRKA